jgi:hypothetical protein
MTVAWDNGRRSTLGNSDIARLESSTGWHPFALRGMAAGFLGGAVVGAGIGALRYEPSCFLDLGRGPDMLAGGPGRSCQPPEASDARRIEGHMTGRHSAESRPVVPAADA